MIITLLAINVYSDKNGKRKIIDLPAGTIIFENPGENFKFIGIVPAARRFRFCESRTIFPPSKELRKYFTFYKIKVGLERYAWASPQIRRTENYVKSKGDGSVKITMDYVNPLWRKVLLGISVFISLALGGMLIWQYNFAKKCKQIFPDKYNSIAAAAFLVFLRWSILLVLVAGAGNIILFSSDEPAFFEVARGLWEGNYVGPWSMTLGQGILYLPFVGLFNAKSIFDIIIPFSWFSGLVLTPAATVMFYFIIYRVSGSRLKAFLSCGLWIVLSFFVYYRYDIDKGFLKSYCALPIFDFGFRFYKSLTWAGFNAMSDTPAMFFMMLTLMLTLYMRKNLGMLLTVSVLFGFTCLIRINYIFFAPLLAWLFWKRFGKDFIDKGFLLKALLVSTGTFLLVFMPQFLVNHFQCGSVFNFPYIYHDEANAGFEFTMLATGIPVLVKANLAFLTLGMAGLLTLKDRSLRIIFILWIVPLLLFFFGYKCVESDAVRFLLPLFPAMSAAFVFSGWQESSRFDICMLVVLCALSVLLVCPSDYSWDAIYPFDLQNYSWGITVAEAFNILIPALVLGAIIFLALRHKCNGLALGICFAVLYFSCLPWLFAMLCMAAGIWALFDCGRELKVLFTDK
jgi:hypothetical protein